MILEAAIGIQMKAPPRGCALMTLSSKVKVVSNVEITGLADIQIRHNL